MDYREQLKILRERRGEDSPNLLARLKNTRAIHRELLSQLETGAKTVPELAGLTGRAAGEVFWHLMALRKYNTIIDEGKKGEYVLYAKKS